MQYCMEQLSNWSGFGRSVVRPVEVKEHNLVAVLKERQERVQGKGPSGRGSLSHMLFV